MKYFWTILLVLIAISKLFCQVNIGKGRGSGNLWVAEHKEITFEVLKEKITVFVLPSIGNNKELQSTIKSLWTFNDITFVDQSDYDSNKEKYYSSEYIIIKLLNFEYTLSEVGIVKGHYNKHYFKVYTIDNVRKNKKGEFDSDVLDIAEIYLKETIFVDPYEEGNYGMRIPLVKNYFQELNRRLVNSQNLKMLDGIENQQKLKVLSTKTLYIPWAPSPILSCEVFKYHLEFGSRDFHTGFMTAEDQSNFLISVFEDYDFKYEIITQEQLDQKILNKDDFFYINCTQFSAFNILSINNGKNGEMIYLDVKKATYRLKSSRIKAISKAVSKA